jgi:hypothetical protein
MADRTTKPIRDVEVNDAVVTTDVITGISSAHVVAAVHVNVDTALADLHVSVVRSTASETNSDDAVNEEVTIHTTQHHPIWDEASHAWMDASLLVAGHQLRTDQGAAVTVHNVRAFTGEAIMFDLTVSDVHAYYVMAGTTPVLVHNCGDLEADARVFADAHVLDEHVNITRQDALALAAKKGTPNGVFHDQQMAQVIVDYTQAFHATQIKNWLRGSDERLVITDYYGPRGGSLGWLAMPDGTTRQAGNQFTIVLQRQKGHSAGYYVYTAFPE